MLPVSDYTYPSILGIVSPTGSADWASAFSPATTIRVSQDGWFPWKYAVHVVINDGGWKWTFTDHTNDTYHLWCVIPGSHRVNYNSRLPAIQAMTLDEATGSTP